MVVNIEVQEAVVIKEAILGLKNGLRTSDLSEGDQYHLKEIFTSILMKLDDTQHA